MITYRGHPARASRNRRPRVSMATRPPGPLRPSTPPNGRRPTGGILTGEKDFTETTELARNGIMHGTLASFDNENFATKALNRLFAVTNWADARIRQTVPVEPTPTLHQPRGRWREVQSRRTTDCPWRNPPDGSALGPNRRKRNNRDRISNRTAGYYHSTDPDTSSNLRPSRHAAQLSGATRVPHSRPGLCTRWRWRDTGYRRALTAHPTSNFAGLAAYARSRGCDDDAIARQLSHRSADPTAAWECNAITSLLQG